MKNVAIIGASKDRAKYGNKAVRAYLQQGYQVYPVNPKEESIEGLRCYRSVTDLPCRPDIVSIYLPPEKTMIVLEDVAEKGCQELWLNPGSESAEVIAKATQLELTPIQACSILSVGTSPNSL